MNCISCINVGWHGVSRLKLLKRVKPKYRSSVFFHWVIFFFNIKIPLDSTPYSLCGLYVR